MNNRAVTLSVAMAILAIFFMQSYVSSIEEEAKKKFGTEVLAVVASKDIKEMATIDETYLELKAIPKRFLEPAVISFSGVKEEDAKKDMRDLVGTVAIVPIKKGEQISYNKLTEPSMRTGLSPQVTPGRRAVSIPVTEITGVSKLIKPGDRVDLIAVIQVGTSADSTLAKTILQDVPILSVGRYITNNVARLVEMDELRGKESVKSLASFDGFSSVTLEVDPTQAQKIAVLVGNPRNQLILSLRNNDDNEQTGVEGLTMGDVLGRDAAKVVRGPASTNGGQRR